MLAGVLDTPPPVARIPPPPPPLHTTMFPCIALVMPFSRDTLTELNMTLVRLSGPRVCETLWSPNSLVSGWPHPLWPGPDGPMPWRLGTPPLFVLSKWRR